MTDLRIRWTGGEMTVSPGATVRIGREPSADIQPDNPNVSRQHAEAAFSTGGWVLRDAGSAQGTWRNGQRVDSIDVRGTVQVTLGKEGRGEVITLEATAAPAATPPTEVAAVMNPVEPTVIAGDDQRSGGRGMGGSADTVVVGAAPHRPGGALRENALIGDTVVTGDIINVECAGRSYSFAPGREVTIGRDDSCDVASTNPTVSRVHARLTHDGSGWKLRDNGSSGGTFVDGKRISEQELSGSVAAWLGDVTTGERVVLVASGPTATSRSGMHVDGKRILAVAGAGVAVLVIAVVLITRLGAGGSPPTNDALGRATVRLVADDVVGSGTIIDAERGLILTNAHVVDRDAPGTAVRQVAFDFELDASPRDIEVHVAPALGKTAEPRFIAEVVAVDGYLDLAVLRITKTIGGQLIEPDAGDLDGLVEVEIGDSDDVNAGDSIKVFGYPTAAQTASVTLTEGSVSGLVQDDRLGSNRAMLNITAAISPGNSGGLAVNDDGQLIGIPSLIRDDTVPSMRPSTFAEALVDAVDSEDGYVSPWFRELSSEEISGLRLVERGDEGGIEFDCNGGALSAIDGSAIGVAFDYEGFTPGDHQDMLVLIMSGDSTIGLRTLDLDYPVDWSGEDGCATITILVDVDSTVDPESLSVIVGLGPEYDTDW